MDIAEAVGSGAGAGRHHHAVAWKFDDGGALRAFSVLREGGAVDRGLDRRLGIAEHDRTLAGGLEAFAPGGERGRGEGAGAHHMHGDELVPRIGEGRAAAEQGPYCASKARVTAWKVSSVKR